MLRVIGKVNNVLKLYRYNLRDMWLAIPGCESLVVVNKLGGVECVRLLLNRELHVVSSVV